MIFLQVFSHCAFMLSLPGFCVFFLSLIYCSTQENQGYFHHHTTIQPTYPLSPSLPSFSLSYSICLPHQLYPTNTAIFTPKTYGSTLHYTQITISPPLLVLCITYTLPSHLPFLCYQHTHTTISPPLLVLHNTPLPSHNAYFYTLYVSPTTHLHYYLWWHTHWSRLPFLFLFLWKICSHVTLTVNKKNFPEISGGRIQGESRSQFSSSSPFLSSSSSLSPLLFLSSLTGTG